MEPGLHASGVQAQQERLLHAGSQANFPTARQTRPKSRKPTNQSSWWWAATTPVEKSALLRQPPTPESEYPLQRQQQQADAFR